MDQSKTDQREQTGRSSSLKRLADQTKAPEPKKQKVSRSIADLPLMIIDAIFKKIPTSDLLNCRQVNHQWNRISSQIMRQRADIEVQFTFKDEEFMHMIRHRCCKELLIDGCCEVYIKGSKNLTDFVVCLAKSTDFPFTNFRFDNLQNFWSSDIRSFLAFWGSNIVTLNVVIDYRHKDVRVGLLRKLLFDRVPNLKKLEIDFCGQENETYSIFHRDIPDSIQFCADLTEFQLPQLELLSVYGCRETSGIIENIIRAATNLKTFSNGSIDVSTLEMLQKLNKLHCLKQLRFDVTEQHIDYWAKSPQNMDLKLRYLHLSFESTILENQQLKSSATSIINQIFRSSRDVMHTLVIPKLGSLTALAIPKLETLKQLHLAFGRSGATFPPLFDMAGTFPNVKELVVEGMRKGDRLDYALPNVEILRILCEFYEIIEFNENDMRLTANLKTLVIDADYSFESNEQATVDFAKISKNWPKLESFGWHIDVETHHSLTHKLDALITGLPVKLCKKLSQKFRSKNRLSATEVDAYHLKREKSSILDLKELTRLDIRFVMSVGAYVNRGEYGYDNLCNLSSSSLSDEAGFDRDSIFYKTGISKVSKFLAFDLMPNLKVRTHKCVY